MAAKPDPSKWGLTTVAAGMPFTTSHDGELITRRPLDLVLAGAGAGVDLLIGHTSDEMLALVATSGPGDDATATRARSYLQMFGADEGAYEAYEKVDPAPSHVLAAAMRDALFRVPAIQIADSRQDIDAATFMYEFGWASPFPGLGAAHGLDLGFIFDNLGQSPIEGPEPSQKVASDVHAAWINFATTGNPGWAPYKVQTRPVNLFNDEGGVVEDPHSALRKVWPAVA